MIKRGIFVVWALFYMGLVWIVELVSEWERPETLLYPGDLARMLKYAISGQDPTDTGSKARAGKVARQ